ncbi:MAG: cytochrome C, partial [Betaproteobacteria bacterium]|nr:cytochrome C [Betaproteobacteria bacterium]
MKRIISAVAFMVSFLVIGGPAPAAQDHSKVINGPFKTGPEVTKACLQCHESHARDFMKTVHWTWSAVQEVPG